ncbi:MAG: hypothetical protein KBF93_00440 [Leptospiraceae bacterium]|nr:hypothetical protein [Leptospiraceae bacterium]
MLYIANLTSIILLVFAISFLMADPWGKEKNNFRKDQRQTAKLTKNKIK